MSEQDKDDKNIIKSFDSALSRIDEAVGKIEDAQKLNRSMQIGLTPGTPAWHLHETIDDKLHDALGALGQ